jgi:hypothetical protein
VGKEDAVGRELLISHISKRARDMGHPTLWQVHRVGATL